MDSRLGICVTLLVYLVYIAYGDPEPSTEHLYWEMETGRHFDDVITVSKQGGYSDTVALPTILMIYNTSCERQTVVYIRKQKNLLPQEIFVNILKYNYDKAQNYWFNLDDKDDLIKRYDIDTQSEICPRVIYLEAESKVDQYEEVPSGLDLHLLLWHKFHHQLSLENLLNKTVYVKVTHLNGNDVFGFAVAPSQARKVYCHVTQVVTVYDPTWNLLYGELIRGDQRTKYMKINKQTVKNFRMSNMRNVEGQFGFVQFDKWFADMTTELGKERVEHRHWLIDMQRMYSLMNTYPANLPRLTQVGYDISQVNRRLFDLFISFSRNPSKDVGVVQENSPTEPTVNAGDAVVRSWVLPRRLETEIETFIKPLAEKFCGTQLQFLRSVVTSYPPGSFVRDTIQWRDGFVIEAMIILGDIMKDDAKGDTNLWKAEIVDFDGNRRELPLKQGNLMLYETKVLIMSRRKVIATDRPYHVVHINFIPQDGWPVKFMKERFVTDKAKEEQVDEAGGKNSFDREYGDEL